MAADYSKTLYNDYEKLITRFDATNEEHVALKKAFLTLKKKYEEANKLVLSLSEKIASQKEEISIKEKEINDLQKEIAKLNSIANNNSTNSGLPTSKTPLNMKKVIPNSRVKTGKSIGGQIGHKRHKLEKFND
jgi:chromosome segregation ATPase